MPEIECPECGVEWTYSGHLTAPTCPTRLCETKIHIGGPSEPREDVGLTITDVRERLEKRRKPPEPP